MRVFLTLAFLFLVTSEGNRRIKSGGIRMWNNIPLTAGESKLIRSEPHAAFASLLEDILRDERLLETAHKNYLQAAQPLKYTPLPLASLWVASSAICWSTISDSSADRFRPFLVPELLKSSLASSVNLQVIKMKSEIKYSFTTQTLQPWAASDRPRRS